MRRRAPAPRAARAWILPGVRRRVLLSLSVALLAAAGCGPDRVREIATWRAEPPYIPPPEPGARAPQRAPAQTSAASRAPTDAQVARELEQAFGTKGKRIVDAAGLTGGGLATVPPSAPARVADVINAANQVARKPYVYGGGGWMTVAGLRFDTSGRSEGGSRWTAQSRGTGGFTLRHPPGL
jgi:hypothetical protein